jgi:hypothetical protein
MSVPIDRIELMTDARDLALPSGYTDLLGELKDRVRAARTQAIRTVNTQLIDCTGPSVKPFWNAKRSKEWGSRVIGRLAEDLRAEFPDMKGLSRSNLFYMRRFAAAWPEIQLSHSLLDNCRGATSRCILDKRLDHRQGTGTPRCRSVRVVPQRPHEHDHEQDPGTHRGGALKLCPTPRCTRL